MKGCTGTDDDVRVGLYGFIENQKATSWYDRKQKTEPDIPLLIS